MAHNPLDVALYEAAIMYDIDVANAILANTATTYTQSANALVNWLTKFMPTASYREEDTPLAPPRRDPL